MKDFSKAWTRGIVLLHTLDSMNNPVQEKTDIHSEEFLRSLMRRQLRLSIACAVTFLVALLGLPLANYFLPELMAKRVFGFTLTWFILGVLFFPLVWAIAWVFIKRSVALEDSEVAEVRLARMRDDETAQEESRPG